MLKLVLSIPVTWSDFCINPRKTNVKKWHAANKKESNGKTYVLELYAELFMVLNSEFFNYSTSLLLPT